MSFQPSTGPLEVSAASVREASSQMRAADGAARKPHRELPQQTASCVLLWLSFEKLLLTDRRFKNTVRHLRGFRNLNPHLQT